MDYFTNKITSVFPKTTQTIENFAAVGDREVDPTLLELISRLVDHPLWRSTCKYVWETSEGAIQSFGMIRRVIKIVVHTRETVCDPLLKMSCVAALYAMNPTKRGLIPVVVYLLTELGLKISDVIDTLLAFMIEAGASAFSKSKELSQTLLNMIKNHNDAPNLSESPNFPDVPDIEPCSRTWDDLIMMVFMPIACKLSQLGHSTTLVLKGLEKALGSFTKMASGIKAVEYLTTTIKQSFEYLCSVIYGDQELTELYEIAANRPPMEGNSTRAFTPSQFVDLSILFGTAGSIDDCKNSGSKRSILNDLISAWRQIQFQNKDKKHLIVQILEPLESIKKFVDTEKRTGSRKFEPFHVSFGGKPGIGKSTILPILVQALGSEHMLGTDPLFDYPSDPGMHSYAIPFGSKYFDGYKGQYTVLLDDICQEKCPSTEGASANILIRMISCISNNMEGSAVDDKIVPFSSRVILTTTNDMYPNDQTLGISTPSAFHRRRHLLYKVIETDVEDPILHRKVAFQLYNSIKYEMVGEPQTFLQLLVTFKQAFTLHTRKELALMNKDTSDLDILLKEALEIQPTCLLRLNDDQIQIAQDKAALRIPQFEGRRKELYETTAPILLQLSPVEGVIEHTMPCMGEPLIVPEDPSWTAHWEYYLFEVLDNQLSNDSVEIVFDSNDVVISDDDFDPDDDPEILQLINNTIRMYTETNPMTPIESLIGTSHNNSLPFFRCDGTDLDESTVDNKPLMALQFLKGLISLDFEIIVQGKILEINPVASVSRAVGIIQQLGMNEADLDREFFEECQFPEFVPKHGTYRIDCTLVPWIPNDSKEVKRMKSCGPGDWWAIQPCGYELAPLRMIYLWRSFKQFVKTHYRKLLLTALIVPSALYIWNAVTSKVEPTYIGSGVGRASNYVKVNPTSGAISKAQWAVVVNVGVGTGSGFMIKGRSFITSRHSFPAKPGDTVRITLAGKVYEETFNPANLFISSTGDFAIYTMSNQKVPLAPDSVKQLYSNNTPKKIEIECILGFSQSIQQGSGHLASHRVHYTSQNVTYQPEAAYAVAGTVVFGDSGSLVIDRAHQQPFGMVVAKGQSVFYVERLPVAEIRDYFSDTIEATSLNMPFVRKAEQTIPQMSKSKLTVSGLYKFLTAMCYYKPAKLRSSNPDVDLLTKSMSGYDHTFATLDPTISNQVVAEFRSHDVKRTSNVPRQVLSFDEALNGVAELKPFEISTSPGLPWKLMPINQGVSGKRAFISGDCPNRTSPLWEEACENYDFESQILGYACLKDELRPLASVEAEKTRSFIVLPADFNLKLRQFFGSFVAAQHTRAGHESSCVGINPYESWDLIYSRLSQMNEKWEDFDYTEWDRTLSPDWFLMYADRVSNWYNDGVENRVHRRQLMQQLVFAQVQIGGDIFQLKGGNKSGCSITAEINTDIHQMLMAYTWIKLAREHDPAKANVAAMFQHNEFVFYGDDQVKSTDPAITWFNGNTIEPLMIELGMKITPGNKTDTEFVTKPPSEITFLKRGFGDRSAAGKLACPLSFKSVSKMLYYVHKSDNLQEATQLNLETACKEMFFHGKEAYNKFINDLVEIVQRNNLDYTIPTRLWEDLERDWIHGYMEAPKYW